MSTLIRAEVSPKSPYYISKDRFYELKHFCLQYKDFKKRIATEASRRANKAVYQVGRRSMQAVDPTGDLAASRALYEGYTRMIEECCKNAGGDIAKWIFLSVTTGKSYYTLDAPCSKEYFYKRYREFFWLLDKCR